MPSSYTTSLRLTLPATGELTGTWGTTVNTGITELLDAAVAGTTTISTWGGAGIPYTLSNTDGAADEARRMFIVATGAPGEAKNVICPAVSKLYFFRNNTSGGFALTLKTSGGSGIAVPAGQARVLYCDGTNVVEAFNALSSLTLGTALAVTSGGTGTTTSTGTGSVVLSNSPALTTPNLGTPSAATLTNATGLPVSTGISGLGAGVATFLATPSSANLAAAVTDETGTGALVFATSPAFTTPNLGTPSAATLTNATGLPLTTGVTGTLAASNGGTGQATYTTGDLIYATGATTLAKLGIGASTTVLTSSGSAPQWTAASSVAIGTATNLAGGTGGSLPYQSGAGATTFLGIGTNGQILTSTGTAPQWSTLSGVAVTTFSAGTTGFTPSTATSGAVTLAGTLATTNGGTGLTSFTSGGVVYASSTSALATGSSLVFDGSNLGIGTSSPGVRLDVSGGSIRTTSWVDITPSTVTNNALYRSTNTGGTFYSGLDNSAGGVTGSAYSGMLWHTGAYPIEFATNNTERMRLDASGNLGIGTSSPGVRVQADADNPTRGIIGLLRNSAASGQTGAQLHLSQSGIADWVIGQPAATNALAIWSSRNTGADGTERLRLDASGNLGLGVTPSAWGGTYAGALQVKSAALYSASDLRADLASNAFYNGTAFTYINTGFSTALSQVSGQFRFFTAPSGTAGNAISFTQAMTLDASGNLGIGTSSPGYKLEVIAPSNSYAANFRTNSGTAANDAGVLFINTSSATAASRLSQIILDANGANGLGGDYAYLGMTGDGTATFGNQFNGALVFSGNAERARIDTSGNLLVGTTTNTNSSRLTVNGTISETVSSVQYLVASQFDVGTAPNKIPLNQYLGNLAYQNASAIAGRVGLSAGTAALPSIGSATDAATGEWFPAASTIAWSTAGAERMRLDASGNVGLGLTPSAWGSNFKAIQGFSNSQFGLVASTNSVAIGTNYYHDNTNYIYTATGQNASRYDMTSAGVHRWFTAPSGTAGNTISFTQAMTLSANGNLLVGVTSDTGSARGVFGGSVIATTNTISTFSGDYAGFDRTSSKNFRIFSGTSDATGSVIEFYTGVSGAISERARITSNGNQVATQPAESAQNTSVTLTVANLQTRIITSNAAVTLTLPTGTDLEGYTGSMATNTAFECTFIATTANAITIAANGNTTVGSLTVAGNTSGTFRFRKTATNTFTVYRVA